MAQGDITVIAEDVFGTLNVVIGEIELSAAYSAGGVALDPPKFGLSEVYFVDFEPVELSATNALLPRYDRATDKVMIHEGDGPTTAGPLAETDEALTSATDLRFKAYGRK